MPSLFNLKLTNSTQPPYGECEDDCSTLGGYSRSLLCAYVNNSQMTYTSVQSRVLPVVLVIGKT